MTLEAPESLIDEIREHARRDYPEECCGVLLGQWGGRGGRLLESRPLPNVREGQRKRRFLISPKDYIEAEEEARRKSLEVLGFYHSHPDHPARPSEFDREHALPNFHYIVVSVTDGRAEEVTCWRLTEDRSKFEQEDLRSPSRES